MAVFIVVAMVFLAFVVDRGRIYVERNQLQNAVDAAALAAIQNTCIADNQEVATELIASQYLAANGVDASASGTVVDIVVEDRSTFNSGRAGVTVYAERYSPGLFGRFAGVEGASVAARATALRTCEVAFQYVADKDTNFNGGTPNIAGNIYAGKCFDGDGGNFGQVAVITAESPSAKDANCGNWGGPGTYAIWNNNSNATKFESCPPGVTSCAYGVTITTDDAIESAGYTITDFDPLLAAAAACPKPKVGQATLDAGPLVCTGGIKLDNGVTVKYDLVTDGDISDGPDSVFDGSFNDAAGAPYVARKVLVYSRDGGINLQTNGSIASNYVFYAPTPGNQPAIVYTGGGANLNASFIGYDIVSNGEGATGGLGVTVRFPGLWRLSQ